MPRRTPRRPSMGFCSCMRRTSTSMASSAGSRVPVALPTATFVSSSMRAGMNSWSGGSMRRTVMALPSMTSSISRKSCFWSFSSSLNAAWRSSESGAERIARSTSGRRSPRNMCSVRHRPMPSAPKAMARLESRGVSALARTCRRRTLSAWARSLSTASTSSRVPWSSPAAAMPASRPSAR